MFHVLVPVTVDGRRVVGRQPRIKTPNEVDQVGSIQRLRGRSGERKEKEKRMMCRQKEYHYECRLHVRACAFTCARVCIRDAPAIVSEGL